MLKPGETIERDPFALPRDPLSTLTPARKVSIATRKRRDMSHHTPTRLEWEFDQIQAAMDWHVAGRFGISAMLLMSVVADAKVRSTLGCRTSAFVSAPVSHRRSRSGDPIMARAALDAWRDVYERMITPALLSEIKETAIMLGFCLCEIKWDTTGAIWRPILKVWSPKHVYYDYYQRQFYVTTQDGSEPITPGDGSWFMHLPHGDHGGWSHGAIRSVAQSWLDRYEALRDWTRYNERHGLPTIILETPSQSNADEVEEVIQGLAGLTGESVIHFEQDVGGQTGRAYMLESTDPNWESFKSRIENADRDIESALLWQPAAIENKSVKQDRGQAGARQALLEFDEKTFVHDLREQVARVFCAFNFDNADLAPYTHYDIEPQEDLAAKLSSLESFSRSVSALNGSGYEFDVKGLARGHGIYLPGVQKVSNGQPYEKATTAISDGTAVGTGAGAPQQGVIK